MSSGHQRPPAQTFRPREHIRRRRDYERVFETGQRIHGRFMTVILQPNGGSVSRLGIAAGRKVGGATARNRAKRIGRELFRRNKLLSAYDVIFVPRPGFLSASFASLETDYLGILRRRRRNA